MKKIITKTMAKGGKLGRLTRTLEAVYYHAQSGSRTPFSVSETMNGKTGALYGMTAAGVRKEISGHFLTQLHTFHWH